MAELATRFPDGMSWKSPYDPTVFVRDSIRAVVDTLLEAVILVVLVVILFLQTWRASIIPLLAVPISVVGTFAVLYMLGFSLNTLSLFGLVLAIGIVVDDAIVVVENVERNIEEGLSPLAAAHQAMREVSGPIIAIAVVLCAVFVPMAFLSGVTGQFYKQFAVTIAISTVISAINSLTLSPALAARLLKPHGAPKDLPSRLIDRLFGWLFRPFNRFFASGSQRYQRGVSRVLGRRGAVFVVYLLLLAAAGVMFKTVPGGFIPTQDKLYLIGGVKMPEGASLERTDAVIRKMSAIGLSVDGVTDAVAFPGLNALQFTNTPNTGTVFFALESLSTRTRTAAQINAEINARISQIQEGFAFSIMPPPILGIGQVQAIRCTCRIAAGWVTARCKRRSTPCPAPLCKRRGWGSRSPRIRPTCRSWTPKSIATRPRHKEYRSMRCSARCRPTSVRLTSTTSTAMAALEGDGAGRRPVPRQRGRHRQPAHPQQQGRNGADRQYGQHRYHLRPGSGDPL